MAGFHSFLKACPRIAKQLNTEQAAPIFPSYIVGAACKVFINAASAVVRGSGVLTGILY